MADEKASGVTGTLAGWIKAGLTSVIGLVSGAFLMYLTPVINNTIKPAKPLANFAAQTAGLAVTFNNHSTGGVDGWWDFGDGSVLEPFSPKLPAVTHTYDKPGTYNVKLALTNLIGEENDRTVPITIDGTSAAKPEITLFEITPVTPAERAPAVYKLHSKINNATLCLLSLGDDRPTQLDADGGSQERYLTFEEMGAYTIRLSAVNGKALVEKSKTVYVGANDSRDPMAKLKVTYEAVKVDRAVRSIFVNCVWQSSGKESVSPFHAERTISHGYLIQSAEIVNKDEKNAPVRKLSVDIAADKTRFSVNGELVKPTTFLGNKVAPSWKGEVKVALERRSAPVVINRGDVMMAVSLNNAVKIPMQPLEDGWEIVRKQVSLELWDGTRKVWEGTQPVTNAKVMLQNQLCYATVLPQKDGMLVKIDAPTTPPVSQGGPTPLPALPAAPLIGPSPPPVAPQPPSVPSVVRPAGFDTLPLMLRPKKN